MLADSFDTVRLTLRPIIASDAGAIFQSYAADPEVSRFLTWRPHLRRDETDAYVARCIAAPPHVSRTYVLSDRITQQVLGTLDLRLIGAGRIDLGYVLARAWWGQGLMTEALTHIAEWALTQPAIFRIGAVCDVENPASARVMEKAGMTREGLLRRWTIHPNISDEPRDVLIYARVRA